MAAHRAAGDAFGGTLNEQLTPSALRPALLPAAKAALVALMQNTNNAVAIISMVNLMARSFPRVSRHCVSEFHYITKTSMHEFQQIRPGPCIKTWHRTANNGTGRVSIPAQHGYHSTKFS